MSVGCNLSIYCNLLFEIQPSTLQKVSAVSSLVVSSPMVGNCYFHHQNQGK